MTNEILCNEAIKRGWVGGFEGSLFKEMVWCVASAVCCGTF